MLKLTMLAFPLFYLAESRFEDAIYSVIFYFHVIDLTLIVEKLVLKIFVLW
jgi:hypothetical protein